VYLHGLIFDENGRKMSKSFGNVVDPLDIIKDYSVDALRLTTTIGNTPGNNLNFSIKTVEQNMLLLNKLWNVARFIATNIEVVQETPEEIHDRLIANYEELLPHEKWILSRLRATIDSVTEGMEKYNFSEKGQELIAFLRDELADFAVEEYKLTKTTSPHGRDVIAYSVLATLKLLHPYIPFVTEELYGRLTEGKVLITSAWPVCQFLRDESLEKDMALLYEVIREVRNVRASKGVKPGNLVDAVFVAGKKSSDILEANRTILLGLAKLSDFSISKKS
jgi:valyl-tRNA synthetase